MPCTDSRTRPALALLAALLLAGCGQTPLPAPAPAPPAAAAAPAAVPQPPVAGAAVRPAAPPPWRRPRNWDDVRLQVAQRMVALYPEGSYLGPVPEPLLAIPVLEVELNGDGSVRRIQVLRRPTQAHDTVQLAIDAVQRAAPFGSISHLPRPWRFTETFLFDDRRRFKPRTLDE